MAATTAPPIEIVMEDTALRPVESAGNSRRLAPPQPSSRRWLPKLPHCLRPPRRPALARPASRVTPVRLRLARKRRRPAPAGALLRRPPPQFLPRSALHVAHIQAGGRAPVQQRCAGGDVASRGGEKQRVAAVVTAMHPRAGRCVRQQRWQHRRWRLQRQRRVVRLRGKRTQGPEHRRDKGLSTQGRHAAQHSSQQRRIAQAGGQSYCLVAAGSTRVQQRVHRVQGGSKGPLGALASRRRPFASCSRVGGPKGDAQRGFGLRLAARPVGISARS